MTFNSDLLLASFYLSIYLSVCLSIYLLSITYLRNLYSYSVPSR